MSTQSFKVKSGLTLNPTDLTTLSNPQAGDLVCDINDSNKIKRYDANAAAWTEVGSGGVGGTDIFFVQDFESASLSSFTQTGLTLSQTDPLHGRVSALLTHQAGVSPTNDQSFKQIIPVDRKFRGETMTLRLNAKSNASAGNVTINIYDETNAANLVVSQQLQLSNDASGAISRVGFTIPETCASISYTITALPEAGSPVTRIDDIIAELAVTSLLETSVEVPVVTAWQGYTPTFQGFGTGGTGPTNIEFEWRRVGENVEIRGKFTNGTSTAVEARVGLPSGLTSAGTSIIPSLSLAGTLIRNQVIAGGYYVVIEPSVTYVTLSATTGSNNAFVKLNGDAFGASNLLSFFASVPCAGLSATSTKTIALTQSGLVQEADSYLRITGFTPTIGSTNTRILTLTSGGVVQNNMGSDIIYTDSAVNGASFTAQSSGIYTFSLSAELGTASSGLGFSVNSTQLTTGYNAINAQNKLPTGYDMGGGTVNLVSTSVYLNAGDIIRIHADNGVFTSANGNYSVFVATKQGSLSQVSVNPNSKITIPTSELRFEGASTRGSTATAIVKFDTMAKLRGDAFTVESDSVLGTRITMKKAGKISMSSVLAHAVATNFYITRNQASLTTPTPTQTEALARATTAAANYADTISWSGFVNVGDILRISADTAPNGAATNNLNLSFQEQDIAVSVTNTLPQFSESDSSVEVYTGNGLGSVNTSVRRFASTSQNIGTDVVYTDSATLGASFRTLTSGVYNISYTDQVGAASSANGIAKNQVSFSANINQLATSQSSNASESIITCSWQGYLTAGDIIYPVFTGTASTSSAYAHFTISKVGKPNVTGVDVTPFVNVPQPENQSSQQYNGSTVVTGAVVYTGVLTSTNGSALYSYNSTSGVYTILKNCKINLSITARSNAAVAATIYINKGTSSIAADSTAATANLFASCSIEVDGFTGDTFTFGIANGAATNFHVIAVTATALSDQILTAPETFSTDTAALAYSSTYTLATLSSAPIGSYITFTYAANTNTRTQTSTRPDQTDANMNANGILLYTRAYNAASTAALPSTVAIQIGKGLKGTTVSAFAASAKTGSCSLDFMLEVSGTTQEGVKFRDYDEKTGILFLDVGYTQSSAITTNRLIRSDTLATATTPYFVINASKNPALTGIGLSRIAARGVNSSAPSFSTTPAVLTYDAVKTLDTHGALNTTTGIFTSPEDGLYQVNAQVYFASATYSNNNFARLDLYKNGALYSVIGVDHATGTPTIVMLPRGSDIIRLGKGDTCEIRVSNERGSTAIAVSTFYNFFSIAKVSV